MAGICPRKKNVKGFHSVYLFNEEQTIINFLLYPIILNKMANTLIYDRVLLFKNKFEEHLQQEFDILPMHFKAMKDLKDIPLDRIAERLDYMMTEDEYFAGEVGKCTVNAFVRNFNRFRSADAIKQQIDESKKAKEIQKKIEETHYKCEKCNQSVKKSMRYNHDNFTCPMILMGKK